jgi:hypothetical protein
LYPVSRVARSKKMATAVNPSYGRARFFGHAREFAYFCFNFFEIV